jgi:hypothetical protein
MTRKHAGHAPVSGEDPDREGFHVDGHPLLDGARWHYPKQGSPTECAVDGCEHVMSTVGRPTVLDEADGGPDEA